MSGGKALTPEEEREGIIRVLKMGAATTGATVGAAVCRRIVELLDPPGPKPGETREVAASGLRQLAAQGRGAFFSSASLRTIATLLEAPCAEAIATAKTETMDLFWRELADEVEFISEGQHFGDGGVVWIEQATYDRLQAYKQ